MRITQFSQSLIVFFSIISSVGFAESLPNFTDLIKQNAKTVVQIDARANRTNSQFGNSTDVPDLFRYFNENPQLQRPNTPQPRSSRALGSGFFIDNEGYILTNAHVVNGADEIKVSTTDQTEYQAKLIGLDERSDVALLKVDKTGMPFVKIGDSDKIEVGNWVLAIGSPFGFEYTATKGIISAVSRSLPDGTYVPFIQTDAAVNPGNSGGPLFNLAGEVIGINSQIYSNTGTFNGLAFAIPINTAMDIANQLKESGQVSRGWLGVAIQGINQELAESFGLNRPVGALVSSVIVNSPAQQAGIQAGDIILSFNGKSVEKSTALPPLVGQVRAGQSAEVELLRNGEKQKLTVQIGDLDGNKKVSQKTPKRDGKGFVLMDLTDNQKNQLGVSNGVIIKEIVGGSAADIAGFLPNDIILSINNQKVINAQSFQKILDAQKKGKPTAFLVLRNGQTTFIPMEM